MTSAPMLSYVIAGQLTRDTILPAGGAPLLDVPGGNLLYAAAGTRVWDGGIGLLSRVGEDYPQAWLERLEQKGFDQRGVRVLPEKINLRAFHAYPDLLTHQSDNPVGHFARLGLPFPKDLLDYIAAPAQPDSRNRLLPLTVRASDIPSDYLDAGAAHLCPLDYVSHSMLPPTLRHGHINTITLDPSPGYMNPTFWDDVPAILTGVTAFLTNEDKLRGLFQGRSADLWEMAEAITAYGCEVVVIRRGAQGQYLYDGGARARWNLPAYPARVTDLTGAGAAFCGGFLAGYRATYDPLQATLHGSISASLVIEGSGAFYAMDAMPGLAAARMAALKDMGRRV